MYDFPKGWQAPERQLHLSLKGLLPGVFCLGWWWTVWADKVPFTWGTKSHYLPLQNSLAKVGTASKSVFCGKAGPRKWGGGRENSSFSQRSQPWATFSIEVLGGKGHPFSLPIPLTGFLGGKRPLSRAGH